MSRYSSKSHDEVASRKSDASQRRSAPVVNGRPPSPEALSKEYAKGRTYPMGKRVTTHEHQENQMPEDQHAPGYDNDCKGWVRGEGSLDGGLYPQFDHGKLDPNNKPPKAASGLKASGQNMERSPFSAAYRKGAGEGF